MDDVEGAGRERQRLGPRALDVRPGHAAAGERDGIRRGIHAPHGGARLVGGAGKAPGATADVEQAHAAHAATDRLLQPQQAIANVDQHLSVR